MSAFDQFAETNETNLQDTRSIGQILRALRHDQEMTVEQLSYRLHQVGYPLDASTLAKYESGARRLPSSFIPYVAAAFMLSPDEEKALLDAYIAQMTINIVAGYLQGKQQLEKTK